MKLGVSSCLLGNNCRYDGKGSKDKFVVDILSKYCEFIPYCPEGAIFPTPRDTIRLVEDDNDGIKACIPAQNNKDVSEALYTISKSMVDDIENQEICGFILKSKSPSCGLERVKVYQNNNSGLCEKKGEGFFAKQLKERFPYLPIEEEGRLQDPWLKENFLLQIYAYNDLHCFLKDVKYFKELVTFHTNYKYLIYAKSQASYKNLGTIVANHEKYPLEDVLVEYKKNFLEAIAQKDSINKTYNILLHILGYFKKFISNEEKEDLLISCDEYKNGIIPLIAVIKLFNIYVKRFDLTYLKTQKFLNPYPSELALRSDIKAYK